METFKSYVYRDGKHDFSKAYRETLIFQMINDFSKKLNTVRDAEEQKLTVAQKRRWRNEIVRKATSRAEQSGASINDTDVIVDAFFDTSYGQKFAGIRDEWEANEKAATVAAVESWTTGQSPDGTLRFTVSPYDPHFADSDLFDDDNDQIGYVVGATKAGGKPGVLTSQVTMAGNEGPNFFERTANKDLYITGVYLGEDSSVMPTDDARVAAMTASGRKPNILSGPVSKSGFNDIKRYIKTKANAREIRDYLVEATKDNPLTEDERKFMVDACSWLSSSGIDFDLKLDTNGESKVITASLGRRKNIRLLDRDNPRYQGRIYNDGQTSYMSVSDPKLQPRIKGTDPVTKEERMVPNPKYQAVMNSITAEDRLNAIKWYFGESVKLRNNTSLSGYDDLDIGEQETIKSNAGIFGSRSKKTKTVFRNSDTTMVTVGLTNFSDGGKTMVLPIALRVSTPSASNTAKIMPTMGEWTFSHANFKDDGTVNDSGLTALMDRFGVDSSKLYPDDVDPETGKFLNEVNYAHHEYYEHLYAREALNNWVESAKAYHRDLVNIDDLVECYNNYYSNGGDYEYHFSADEDVAEIQKLYWDVLVGVKETGKTKIHDAEDSELEAFDNNIYKSSLDDKVAAIKAHYDNYSENAFGRVPELIKPFATEEENQAIATANHGAGFDPGMVAKYMDAEENYSLQRNYDYMRHMLMNLGDDYDPSFVKDGSYMAAEIKTDMVKYDQSTAIYQNYSSTYDRNTGIPFARVIDENTGEVDYDKLYDLVPALEDKPFTAKMLMHTAETLKKSGCELYSIEVNVDDNGIIEYRGVQATNKGNARDAQYNPSEIYEPDTKSSNAAFLSVSGTIGQIFEPDENGVIVPNYGGFGDAKKVIIPGYDAYLVDIDPDDPKPARDRLRLSGIEQQMRQAISSEIHKATTTNSNTYNFLPHTTAVNHVYKHAYTSEMTVDMYHDMLDPTKTSYEEVETFKASIDTLKHRCRFPNAYGDGSTTEAQSMLENPTRQEAKDYDYYYSDLNDNRNMRVLDEEYDGIFCWRMTGGAKTQGLVRYLVDDATVNADGTVTAAPDFDPLNPPVCAIMHDKMMEGTEHDTWDRNLMSSTQVLTALRTPRDVGVAMLNLNGDTFDDGFTVSKAFAEKYPIQGADGNMRPLIPQDKLADKHGNKGVITRVVDPTQHSSYMMDEVEVVDISNPKNSKVKYRDNIYTFEYDDVRMPTNEETVKHMNEQAVKAIQSQLAIDDDICKFFEENPDLDIVASPYSGMSRFNGGTIRDLMNKPGDLKLKGQTIEGGMGHMDMIVVDMPADVKTHWYDEDAIREGKGRKASGQLLWVLNAKGADKIINEFYGDNNRAWDNLREYAIVTGMDITPDLKPVVGYHEQTERGEHRKLITLPTDDDFKIPVAKESTDELRDISFKKGGCDYNKTDFGKLGLTDRYLAELNESGGFMELPFQLDYKTMSYTHTRGKAKQAGDEMFKLAFTGHTYTTSDGETHETYGMPVLPPSMRSGQDFKDGTARTHDYTKWYLDIAEKASEYMLYEKRYAEVSQLDVNNLTADQKEKYYVTSEESKTEVLEGLKANMDGCKRDAQAYMDKIVGDVVDKQFNTKFNVLREQCMAKKVPSSATAVISAGNKLKCDEVAMSREHAVQLGIMNYDEQKDEYYWANRSLDDDGSVKNAGSGHVLIWRDPILRDGALRYMNVTIDDSVLGIKINPAMGKSFDGDYDGDSYALVALKTPEANAQAYSKFHVSNNLLDLGSKNKDGKYSLYINSGMDVTAIMYEDKTGQLKAQYDDLTDRANMLQAAIEKIEAGQMAESDFTYEARVIKKRDGKTVLDANGCEEYETNDDGTYVTQTVTGKRAMNSCKRECKNDLDKFVLTAFRDIGTDHIVVKNPETVVKSCQHIVDSGAKGNQSKMSSLMANIGIEYDSDENGVPIASTAKNITHVVDGVETPCPRLVRDGEIKHKNLLREEHKCIQETTAYKADNTQLGGTSSQNGVAALRDTPCLRMTLETTYPVTQGILQSKHDPQDAKVKDKIVRIWGRDCWDGYKLTGNWDSTDPDVLNSEEHNRKVKKAYDSKGQPIPMTKAVEDENGNVTYENVVDKDGNTVYETYYEKCTPEEWVKQMMGMQRALKVDTNAEYLTAIAAQMTATKQPIMRQSDRTSPITYFEKGVGRQTVTHAKPVVVGVTEYGEEHGSLLDRVAYTGRMTALVKSAMNNSAGISDDSFAGNAIEKGIEAIAIRNELRMAKGDKTARDAAKAKLDAIVRETSNSGMFISKNIIQEAYGDKYRAETGDTQNVVYRKGNAVKVDPTPLGRKDCQVSAEAYAAGARCMGETNTAYEQRMAGVTSPAPVTTEPVAEPVASTSVTADNPFTARAAALQEASVPASASPAKSASDAEIAKDRGNQADEDLGIKQIIENGEKTDNANNKKNGGNGNGGGDGMGK